MNDFIAVCSDKARALIKSDTVLIASTAALSALVVPILFAFVHAKSKKQTPTE